MNLSPGQSLLHYRLLDKLGEGGMGVVWRAEDTTLHREVAIKVLPETLARDDERLARFSREARLLAALSHPNIAGVYGLHEAEGVHFLAMELVRGEDLSERIARGPLPVEEALSIARKVAEALRAAHANGVIHRDLKPANIRIGTDGSDAEVKVLDFGLAKALASEGGDGSGPGGSPSMSPTITSLGTVAGVLLGTAAYMSPEQARGRAVDRRADVWAFGCVLFEMLTGRLAFPGETITDTLAAVVRGEPDWDALPADLPRAVRHVLRLCLTKQPRERLHDVADAVLLMDGGFEAAPVTPPPARSGRREVLAWALAVAGITFAAVVGLRPAPQTAPPPPTRFGIDLSEDAPLAFIDEPTLAFSPDGRTIAFVARDPETGGSVVYLRALDRGEPWRLPGSEGGSNPFFSPDGTELAFFAGGELKRVPLGGGSPITLAPAPNPRGGAWLPDGTIVFSPEYASGLWQVPGTGGTARERISPDTDKGERTLRWPAVLPGGRAVLFTLGAVETPNNYDQASIVAYSLEDDSRHTLVEGAHMARVLPPDRIVFIRTGVLYAMRFDPDRLEPLGEPARVMEGVGGDPSSGAGYFDVSTGGDLVWIAGAITDAEAHLVLVDREGVAKQLPIGTRGYHRPRFAPDGSKVAFGVGSGSLGINGDIWTYSFADEALRRITFQGTDSYPLWSRDGTRIAFVRGSDATVVEKAADGSGDERLLTGKVGEVKLPSSWTPDETTLAIARTADGRTDAVLLDLENDEARLFAENATGPMISPNGRWVAYASPPSGNASIYVEPLQGEGKWQVSPGTGSYPRWSADGRKLFYFNVADPRRPLMEVDVAPDDRFRWGTPRVVVEDTTRYVTATAPSLNWDTDGERFVFIERVRDDQALRRVEVSLGWAAGLAP